MINRTLFIHKFCTNLKMLLSSSWAIFIRALVFSSSFALALFHCLLMLVSVSILFSYYVLFHKKLTLPWLGEVWTWGWSHYLQTPSEEHPKILRPCSLQDHCKYSEEMRSCWVWLTLVLVSLWLKIVGETLKGFFVTVEI